MTWTNRSEDTIRLSELSELRDFFFLPPYYNMETLALKLSIDE